MNLPFLVRGGAPVDVFDIGDYRPNVYACPLPLGLTRVRVVLEGDEACHLLSQFDVHTAAQYGSERDETRVLLSAYAHACSVAAMLERMFDWELRVRLLNFSLKRVIAM